MSARTAVAIAEQYAQNLLDKDRLVTDAYPVYPAMRDAHIESALHATKAPLAEETPYAQARDYAADHYGQRGFAEVRFTAQDTAQRRLWQQHRVVYDIDPALWTELGDTDTDAVIPVDLFTRLPHPDPFIVFPEPLVLSIDEEGKQQRISGFFVRGHIDIPDEPGERLQVSTGTPGVDALGISFGGFIETTSGQPLFVAPGVRDVIWTRVTLDPRVGRHTVGEMIDATVRRFGGYRETGNYREDIPRMIRRAVSLLVYLCATNADLTPLPKQSSTGTGARAKGKGKGKGRKSKPSVLIGVGYRVGRALAAYRQREQDEARAEAHTGQKKAPHIRRAHFHSYRVGPGRRQTEVKWLSPIPVNMHGEEDPGVVIPVRPVTTR